MRLQFDLKGTDDEVTKVFRGDEALIGSGGLVTAQVLIVPPGTCSVSLEVNAFHGVKVLAAHGWVQIAAFELDPAAPGSREYIAARRVKSVNMNADAAYRFKVRAASGALHAVVVQ